jgi:ATP-dependent Clp protease adaptor protein ClpS
MTERTSKPLVVPEGDAAVDSRPTVKRPRRYRVVFHNDDYTTMEFVVRVLIDVFHKNEAEATQLMLKVHHVGSATVGVYTRDVAETKAEQAMAQAKREGHPLKCTAEPDGEDAPEEGS